MKKIKVSILALSVLVGGAVFASAANSALNVASTSDIALTNAVPLIWSSVNTLPTSAFLVTTQGVSFQAMLVDTDSGGKISGVANVIKVWGPTTNPIAASSFYVTVKGKISASQMAVPTVQMTMNGQGYTAPPFSTNVVIVIPGQPQGGFPGKLNLSFTAKNTAAISNNFAYHILGNLKGNVDAGLQSVGKFKINEPGDLIVNRATMDELDMRVLVYGNKFAAILYNTDATGTGSVSKNNGSYTLNLKPVGGGSSSLQLKGTLVAVTSPPFTNITTINTADVKGKIQGQAVAATAFRFAGFAD